MHIPVKILRRSLVGVVILVLLSALWNFFQTRRTRSQAAAKAPQILGTDMLRSVDSFEYSDNQNGRARFRIRARRLLETKMGKSLLEGIDAYDFNADGSIRNEIRSRKAEYDRDAGAVDFFEDVRLFLGKAAELRTDSLHYDMAKNAGTTRDALRFSSKETSGTARGLRYDEKKGLLRLDSDVSLLLNHPGVRGGQPIHISAQQAAFSKEIRHVLFQGRVQIESGPVLLSGDLVEGFLSPVRNRLTSFTSVGDAAYKAVDPDETRILKGDRMMFGLSESGESLEKVDVFGNALFSSKTPASDQDLHAAEIHLQLDPERGDPRQVTGATGVRFEMSRGTERTTLLGELLEAQFAQGSKNLESIRIRNHASVLQNSPRAETNELHADDIHVAFGNSQAAAIESLRAEGTAEWISKPPPAGSPGGGSPARSLSSDSLEILYYSQGNGMKSGKASGKVVISETDRQAVHRMLADRARFQFFPGDNQIKDLDSEGRVQVAYHNGADPSTDSSSSSDYLRAAFELQEGRSALSAFSQWSRFRYSDKDKTATAGRCDYDASRDVLTLEESPRVVSDAMGSTTAERVRLDQKRKTTYFHNHVRSVFSSRKGEGGFFRPSGSSAPSIVTADDMQYQTETGWARYDGSVTLLSENGQLQAKTLEIFNRGERVAADGDIQHRAHEPARQKSDSTDSGSLPMIIKSSGLEYVKSRNTITYSGNVRLHSRDLDLSADTLDALLDSQGEKIEHALARGKVLLNQGTRECRGESAEYYLDAGRVVVIGNPAEVFDPGRGHSYARRLTSSTTDDRILLENR